MDDLRVEQAARAVYESYNALMSQRAKKLGDPWMCLDFEDCRKFWTAVVQPLADAGLIAP